MKEQMNQGVSREECEAIINHNPSDSETTVIRLARAHLLLLDECESLRRALDAEYPDLDALPEWTPEQRAEMDAEHAEWLQARHDNKKAIFLAGAEAQRTEDAKRAERFDAWFDLKEPRGKILSEEILAAPLAEYSDPPDAAISEKKGGSSELHKTNARQGVSAISAPHIPHGS